jgi:antirestriction protein ArdC
MANKLDVFETITAQIVAQIEAGAGTFQLPWHRIGCTGFPSNVASGNEYTGSNVLVLWCAAASKGYTSPVWGTYRQWAAKGAQVRGGEKATVGLFFKPTVYQDKTTGKDKAGAYASAFSLFNAAQVDGYVGAPTATPDALIDATERLTHADAVFAATGVAINHGGDRAYYSHNTDTVTLPPRGQFLATATATATETYYATVAHELSHASGHKTRLDRRQGDWTKTARAEEELVAELGAAFVLAALGITNSPVPDHAQYVASWLSVLKNNPKAIVTAASAAQKAANWVLGRGLPKTATEETPIAIAA